MSRSPYIFRDSIRVEPIRVKFGGLDALAFEILSDSITAGYSGVCIKTVGNDSPSYVRRDLGTDYEIQNLARYGELQCDSCFQRYRFRAGQAFSFPYVPLPGWMVWGPPALRDLRDPNPNNPSAIAIEPQEIKVRVRCNECSKWLESFISRVFESGYVR